MKYHLFIKVFQKSPPGILLILRNVLLIFLSRFPIDIILSDDAIRQNEGFKNVSLGNVLAGHSTDQVVTFLEKSDMVKLFPNLM